MIYAFVAAVVSAALLIYFIVRIVRDPGDAKYAVHIPRWLFFFGMAVYIAGAAVCIAMLAVGKFFVAIPGFGCMLFGAAAMLCQLDQKVVSAGEGIYIYSTMFGKKKRFNISDFVSMKRNSDSLTLKFKTERCISITLPLSATTSERACSTAKKTEYLLSAKYEGHNPCLTMRIMTSIYFFRLSCKIFKKTVDNNI